MTKIANWKMAIEIVDVAIENGDVPWRCKSLPEGRCKEKLEMVKVGRSPWSEMAEYTEFIVKWLKI